MSGDEDFFLSIAIEIGDDRRRKTIAFEFDRIFVGKVHPSFSEGEIAFMLSIGQRINAIESGKKRRDERESKAAKINGFQRKNLEREEDCESRKHEDGQISLPHGDLLLGLVSFFRYFFDSSSSSFERSERA